MKTEEHREMQEEVQEQEYTKPYIYTAPFCLLPESIKDYVTIRRLQLDTMEKEFPSSIPFPTMHLSPGKVLLFQSSLKASLGRKQITFCPFPEILKLEQDKPAISFAQGER